VIIGVQQNPTNPMITILMPKDAETWSQISKKVMIKKLKTQTVRKANL
jgi:hypothetical protein